MPPPFAPANVKAPPPFRPPHNSARPSESAHWEFAEMPPGQWQPSPSPPPFQPGQGPPSSPLPLQVDTDAGAPPTDTLKQVTLFKSWRSEKTKLPHFLLRGRGQSLEAILQSYVNALYRERLAGVEVAIAGELTNDAGRNRPLRIIHTLREGHRGITDVLFRAEGNDLYVKFQSNPRTWITYLRLVMYTCAFILLFGLLMAGYLYGTGAFSGWALDYAQKHSREVFADEDCSTLYHAMITEGYSSFNNEQFVSELSSGEGPQLLAKVIQAAEQELAAAINPDQSAAANSGDAAAGNDALARTFETLNLMSGITLLKQCGFEAIGLLAREKLESNYNPDQFFWWQSPDKLLSTTFLGIPDTKAIQSLEYTQDVDITQLLLLDFGPGHEQLTQLAVEAYQRAVTHHAPWTPAKLFYADPKLAMMGLGGPTTILVMLIGAILYFVPISILSWPCRLLGWPTADEFQNMVQARNAWAERVLSDTLLHQFGVQEGDRFAILNQ